jgi:hypothetical protein
MDSPPLTPRNGWIIAQWPSTIKTEETLVCLYAGFVLQDIGFRSTC